MKTLRLGLAGALMILLTACASFQQHKNTAELAVTYGTLKFIEKAGEDPVAQKSRAERIAAVATEVKQYVSGSEVTVELLKEYIISKLPADMNTSDRVLVLALVDELVAELQRRIGQSLIGPEQLLAVAEVADWVIAATKYVGV